MRWFVGSDGPLISSSDPSEQTELSRFDCNGGNFDFHFRVYEVDPYARVSWPDMLQFLFEDASNCIPIIVVVK